MKTLLFLMLLNVTPLQYVVIITPNGATYERAWAVTDRVIMTFCEDSSGMINDGIYSDGNIEVRYFREHFINPVKAYMTSKPVKKSSETPGNIIELYEGLAPFIEKNGGPNAIFHGKKFKEA